MPTTGSSAPATTLPNRCRTQASCAGTASIREAAIRDAVPVIAGRLRAAAPGWFATADVVVVGSGIAGLTAALHARVAGRVLLVTKALLDAGSTRWAQGGIAAALAPDDSPDAHYTDTMTAGAGLCDPVAVRVLVDEGPDRVRDLAALGAAFDRDPEGVLELTREGGHLHRRIVHAGGDAPRAAGGRALLAGGAGGGRRGGVGDPLGPLRVGGARG